MNSNDIQHALEILVRYNTRVRHRLLRLKDDLDECSGRPENYKPKEVETLIRAIIKDSDEISKIIKSEEHIERLIKKLDIKIHNHLRRDIRELEKILSQIQSFLRNLLKHDDFLVVKDAHGIRPEFSKFVTKIDGLVIESERILSKDIYLEKLMEEMIEHVKAEWNNNIRGKSTWLYHATSILFLPYVQENGLDSSKLPRGIMRGIETMSKLFAKYGVPRSQGGRLDIVQNMAAKGISLAWTGGDIRRSAWADNLPAFMYELFNEDHLKSLDYLKENVIDRLEGEDKKAFKTIVRFGRMLRKKNRVVLLLIKVDKEFIKHLGLPDFTSDFDTFLSEYFVKAMDFNELLRDISGRKDGASYWCEDLKKPFIFLFHQNNLGIRDLAGIRLQKRAIAPAFIYLDVHTTTGYALINVMDWNENILPKII